MKNKSDIIEAVKASTGLKKQDVEKVIGATLQAIADALKEGEDIQFHAFGTFHCAVVKSREATLPSGKKVTVPEHKSVSFHASKTLRDYMNPEEKE